MKLHVPSLKVPFIKFNKGAVLVTLSLVFFFGVLAYGAVRNVQASRVAAQKARDIAVRQEANKKAEAAASAKVQADLNVQRNKALAACGLLKQYSTAKATAKLISYPPVCSVE